MLGLEHVHYVLHLRLEHSRLKGDENIWLAQITVILRDFVLENQMVAKRVPSQFCDQAVILMCVFSTVGKDKVRRTCFQFLKGRLDLGADKRHKSVLEGLEHWTLDGARPGKQCGGALRFRGADS